MMSTSTSAITIATAATRKGLQPAEAARLMATPFTNRLLGIDLTPELYARNGFRLVGTPAYADRSRVESESQKFRNIYKLDSAAALNACIQTGCEQHIRFDDILASLAKLLEPRQRLLCEIFWPHVAENLFAHIKKEKHLASPSVVQTINASAKTNGLDGTLLTHALAIAHQNLALSHELAFATGQAEWSESHWQQSLACWAQVLSSTHFWNYLRQRAKSFDDPRLKPDDVETLQLQLPVAVLGFNTVFARAYAKAEQMPVCARHLALITQSKLPEAAKREAITTVVKALMAARLEPLIQRMTSAILEAKDKFSREKFERICAPIVDEALAVHGYLLNDLGLEDAVEMAEFDRLCETIVNGMDTKINYDNDDRQRSILYCLLTTKKLLALPVSPAMRRKLEQSKRSDTEILYRDFVASPDEIDPTRCWFVEDEEADPASSLEFPIYKITDREVTVNSLQGSAGISVNYQKRKILVPRSRMAAARQPKSAHASAANATPAANPQAHAWARAAAFFASCGLSIFGIIAVFIIRRIILRRIPDRGAALPIGGYCMLGLVIGIGLSAIIAPDNSSSADAIRIIMALIGIAATIGFGRAAYWAFLQPMSATTVSPSAAPVATNKKVKPLSQAKDFPPFKKALAGAFKEGSKPTDSEMEMTYSEQLEARRRLGIYY